MKIISGGQTGVDRAALDAAIVSGISHGGWCPKGRLAELKTIIPLKYQLKETDSDEFSERTKLNIRDADATLVIVAKVPIKVTDGTILTIQEIKRTQQAHLIIDLSQTIKIQDIVAWLNENRIDVLNIAGPRESQSPGIYKESLSFLISLFPLWLEHSMKLNSQKVNVK